MTEIIINEIDLTTFKVTVVAPMPTNHQVTVNLSYALSLTASKISTEQLLKNSFEFLLAREPNTSILRSFDLSVINRYFPEYEQTMRDQLK